MDGLIKLDKKKVLKFASLQGETAMRVLGGDCERPRGDTVIYLREDKKYDRSTAILMILSDIQGFRHLAKIFSLVPVIVRDFIYSIIAKNRFLFLKKRESCRMPSHEEQARLLP